MLSSSYTKQELKDQDQCEQCNHYNKGVTMLSSSYTKQELKEQCDQRGIKYNKSDTRRKLCSRLGMEYDKPQTTQITFTDKDNGEVLKFSSIYKASHHFGINSGLIIHYDERDMSIGDKVYSVYREIKRKPRSRPTVRRREQYVKRYMKKETQQ